MKNPNVRITSDDPPFQGGDYDMEWQPCGTLRILLRKGVGKQGPKHATFTSH